MQTQNPVRRSAGAGVITGKGENVEKARKPIILHVVLSIALEIAEKNPNIKKDDEGQWFHPETKTKLESLDFGGIGEVVKIFPYVNVPMNVWAAEHRPKSGILKDARFISAKVPKANLKEPLPIGDYDFEIEGRKVRVVSSIRSPNVFVIVDKYEDLYEGLRRLEEGTLVRNPFSSVEFEQMELSYKTVKYEMQAFSSDLRHHSYMFYRLFRDGSRTYRLASKIVRFLLEGYFQIRIEEDKKHGGAVKIINLDRESAKIFASPHQDIYDPFDHETV